MLNSPEDGVFKDDRDLLNEMLRHYAARYYISGTDRSALIAQTITVLAEEPEILLVRPVEKAIASTMHRLFLANSGMAAAANLLHNESRDTGTSKSGSC